MPQLVSCAEPGTSLTRQFLALLPVRDFAELIGQLVRLWCAAGRFEVASVSAVDAVHHRLFGCTCSNGTEILPFERPLYQDAVWSPESALESLEFFLIDRPSSVEIVPFCDDVDPIGGVILLSRGCDDYDPQVTLELEEWSTRLIMQARALHSAMIPADVFDKRLQAAKLDALAELAAGAGHEINNPLATINGRVQLLLAKQTDPEAVQALETIGGQVYRIRDMIGDLMLFARPPRPDAEPLELGAVLIEVLGPLAEQFERQSCRLEIDPVEEVAIWADRTQLAVIISNLVRNSLEACDEGGTVRVTARTCSSGSRACAELAVSDDGCGLSDEDREHLFDPFYSGRQAGRGLGFGLSKCWRIVSNHGGRIDVYSSPQNGTTFTVVWPAEPLPGTGGDGAAHVQPSVETT